LLDAMMDSVPLVAITGQVRTELMGTDGFQEADVCAITQPVTKRNFLISDDARIGETIAEAFALARSGRPGPVLVDIPTDVLKARIWTTPPARTDDARRCATARFRCRDPRRRRAHSCRAAARRDHRRRRPRRRRRPLPDVRRDARPAARRDDQRARRRGAGRPERISGCSGCTGSRRRTRPSSAPTCSSRWECASTTASPASPIASRARRP
jgi:hypothetical protein